MDSNEDHSLPSHSSGNASLKRHANDDSCLQRNLYLQEVYDNYFLTVLTFFLWTEGSEGWPAEPFAIEERNFDKSLACAELISKDFYLLAATECRILSNKEGNALDLKVCLDNNYIRGDIFGSRKLLDDHFRVKASKYYSHENMFEDMIEGMLMEKQFSSETLFFCWTCWKKNIVLALESLSSLDQAEYSNNQHLKFAFNYLGVQKKNDTWFMLAPGFSWVKEVRESAFTKHKEERLVSINIRDLIAFAERYWKAELLSIIKCVLKKLKKFYENDNEHPLAHDFSTLLNICQVVRFLKTLTVQPAALDRLEKYSEFLIGDYLAYLSPRGWNSKMNKDFVILRKSVACAGIVADFVHELESKNDRLNNAQLLNLFGMMLGAPKLEHEAYHSISLLLEDKQPWQRFIWSLMCFDAAESGERTRYMLFYKAIRSSIKLSWIQEDSGISPSSFLCLIERFVLLTLLLKDGVIYTTKSTMTEWLIQNDKKSLKNLNRMTRIDEENLVEVHGYLATRLLDFARHDVDSTKKWTKRHGDDDGYRHFVKRIVVAACLLHLSSKVHYSLLEAMLNHSDVKFNLDEVCMVPLARAMKMSRHIGVEEVATSLRNIDNPLVIATMRNDSLDIVSLDAIFAQPKDESKVSMDPDSFWDCVASLVMDPNLLDNAKMKSILKHCIDLVTTSLQNPLSLESQDEMRELGKLLDEMKELFNEILLSNNPMMTEVSKRILSRKHKVADHLNQLFLMYRRDAVAEWEP